MPHRQVHVDSLLTSMTDTVDNGYATRETKPDRPWISSRIFHIKFNIRYILFPEKRLIGKPQHATTELSEVETWELAEYSIIKYLARYDSHTMLADTGWCTAQTKGDHYGYWIFRKRNEARLALDKAQHVLHVIVEYSTYFIHQKKWLTTLNLQTAK